MLWQIRQVLRRRTSWVPVAPLAAVMVVILVVAVARLAFTGTVRFTPEAGRVAAAAVGDPAGAVGALPAVPPGNVPRTVHGALLVVAGFGSNCCNGANGVRALEPGLLVRQFSYLGLNAAGQPIKYRRAGDLPIQTLGDRMAAQVQWLHAHAHGQVIIVAESEGSLGLYAMLARHPGLPLGLMVLLSPIVAPGQISQGEGSVPGDALSTLNHLVGGISPYGSSGAKALIQSVSNVGARYFASITQRNGQRWLAVVPLADALTLPDCAWPSDVLFVLAFHGGLIGNPAVQRVVTGFLAGHRPAAAVSGPQQQRLRLAAEFMSAAASAWRMPNLGKACPVGLRQR